MLASLRRLFGGPSAGDGPADPAAHIRLCVAALLVEMARADHDEQANEQQAILALVKRHFGLDDGAAADLLAEARGAVDDAVSLREFTAPIHGSLSEQEKRSIVGMLWDVALEDRSLDKYEDYLVGKVAELLYVPRGDVVRLRWEASQRRLPRE